MSHGRIAYKAKFAKHKVLIYVAERKANVNLLSMIWTLIIYVGMFIIEKHTKCEIVIRFAYIVASTS